MSADPPPQEEPPPGEAKDLGELLAALKFSHWRPLLDDLMSRYAGWNEHYWLEPGMRLDFWPAADIIRILVAFPQENAGDDLAFARALLDCDFLVRTASDDGQPWNALAQPYREWLAEHAQGIPAWSLSGELPWPAETLVGWLLAHLPEPQPPGGGPET